MTESPRHILIVDNDARVVEEIVATAIVMIVGLAGVLFIVEVLTM